MQGLLIIGVLFALMYVLMIRPQRAKAQAQQRLLGEVAVGDEILTVGGIYGIVQELEPEEEGGDLVVEIADGIHVRIARRSLAAVVKPDDEADNEDDDEDEEDEEDEDNGDDNAAEEVDEDDVIEAEAEPAAGDSNAPAGVEEVNDEGETVNPGAADDAEPPGRS